jgi:hypothetical protein
MSQKSVLPPGLDSESEMRALRRARDAAREIAARTNTRLVIYRNGKIERVPVDLVRTSNEEEKEPLAP